MPFYMFLMILMFLLGFGWAHALQRWQIHYSRAKEARLQRMRDTIEQELLADGWQRPWLG